MRGRIQSEGVAALLRNTHAHILIPVSEFLDERAIDQVADVLAKVQQELKRS